MTLYSGARVAFIVWKRPGFCQRTLSTTTPRSQFVPKMRKAMKEDIRDHWLRFALRATEGVDLVCVDPGQRHCSKHGEDVPRTGS